MNLERELRWVAAALDILGCPGVLHTGEEQLPVTLVLQPVADRNKSYLETAQTPAGGYGQSYAIGYLPPEGNARKLRVDDCIEAAGENWRVRRAEVFLLQGQPAYLWTVLTKEEQDGPADTV